MRALFLYFFCLVMYSCAKENSFQPNFSSPAIPAAQITNFTYQGATTQFMDETIVYWSGDTLNFQSSDGQNTVLMWFIVDSLRDTTYTFDPLHASIGLYNFQGAQVSHSSGSISANFSYNPNSASSGSVQGTMLTSTPSGVGSACVSFSNIGIPVNVN